MSVSVFDLIRVGTGVRYKTNASISGAEVGCQGEVGSACSMAAAGLAEILGGPLRRWKTRRKSPWSITWA